MDLIDKATEPRKGEELESGKIDAFLKAALPGTGGKLSIRQFPSGYSNLTYLLTIGDRELVLRRPPLGTKAKTAHDMGREYHMLKALRPVFPFVPEPIAYTEDTSIMGCPFYVMERLQGMILRRDLPEGFSLPPDKARQLFEGLLDLQVRLHELDYRRIGLAGFGKPEGYGQRQVTGWSARYRAARTEDAPDFEEVMIWILEKMPPDIDRPSVVHNDYRLDNVVLDPRDPVKIIGVLDWEMATIGDPLMDLGNSLAYWVQRDDPPELLATRVMPTHIEGAPTREEIVNRYAERSARTVDTFDFYYCFGLFRLAVIAQQIYYRYYHGQTKDERFKRLISVVQVLERTARRVMEKSRL